MTLAEQLLAAGDDESLPANTRALLRRAAGVLLEAELDVDCLALIREMSEIGQESSDVNQVVRDWLIAHGRLPFDRLDEDSETVGSA